VIAHDQAPEHEFEAQLGLPEPLPRDERLLWQGAPDWRLMARDAMHLRALSIYFAALLAWRFALALAAGAGVWESLQSAAWLLPLAALALTVLATTGWLCARTSVYTITDRRVVMRIGVVLSITFNLPYARIEGAALHANRDGSGDVTLALEGADQIAYVHLWPHARPWRLKRTQPMLRALRDARRVAEILSAALAQSAGVCATPVPVASSGPRTVVGLAPQHALTA